MRKIILTLLAVFGVCTVLFIVTTTMSTPAKMGLSDGNEPKDPSNYRDIVELVLKGNDHIYAYRGDINSAKLLSLSPENTLRTYLTSIKSSITDSSLVLIRASDKTEYKTTIGVLDEMTINQVKTYAIVKILPQEYELIQATEASNPNLK